MIRLVFRKITLVKVVEVRLERVRGGGRGTSYEGIIMHAVAQARRG